VRAQWKVVEYMNCGERIRLNFMARPLCA